MSAGSAGVLNPIKAAISHPEALAPFCLVDTPQGPKPMDLWPHQREIIRSVMQNPYTLVLKARQLGVSWNIALIALWWVMAHPANLVVLVSIGEREAVSLLRKVRRLYDSMPATIKRAYPLDIDQTMQMSIAHSKGASTILSLPSSSNAGRGETIHLLIGDERPKWPNAEEQEASLLPAVSDSARDGYGRAVMVGTANGMDSIYDRWMGAPSNGWHPIFVGALARPGRTEGWVEGERRALGDLGPQEFPYTAEEAFLASGRCAFDRDKLQELSRFSCTIAHRQGDLIAVEPGPSAKAKKRTLMVIDSRSGGWEFWDWPHKDRSYIACGDVAGGRGDGDYSTIVVYDTTTWEQVAAYRAQVEPAVYARELMKCGYYFAHNGRPALLVPEANNHGQAVVALLRGWGYPNIYRRRTVDKRNNKPQQQLGWATTTQSRNTLVHALGTCIDDGLLGIRDAKFVAEAHRFIWRETMRAGRFEADAGAHDDIVIAHGIAAAVLTMTYAAPRDTDGPMEQPSMEGADPKTAYMPG